MPKLRRLQRCVCPIDIDRVNHAALHRSHELIRALLPRGMTSGTQYVVPSRDERRLISIFLDSGKWGDFAIAHGDDLVSLVAHVFDMAERDAAGSSPICSALNGGRCRTSATRRKADNDGLH